MTDHDVIERLVKFRQGCHMHIIAAVEKPIRFGAFPARRRTQFAAAAIAALGLAGLRAFEAGGLLVPDFSLVAVAHPGDVGHGEFNAYVAAHSVRGLGGAAAPAGPDDFQSHCLQSAPNGQPDVVIVGDSHAHQLYVGVAEALPAENVALCWASAPPLLDDPTFGPIFRGVAAATGPRVVILSVFWSQRLAWLPKELDRRRELDRVVALLRASGKAVYVLNDFPAFPFRPDRCKFEGRLGVPSLCDEPAATLEAQLRAYAGELANAVADNPGARLVDSAHMLCEGGVCSMQADGKLLYRDWMHLNLNGSRLIGAKLVAAVPELAAVGGSRAEGAVTAPWSN